MIWATNFSLVNYFEFFIFRTAIFGLYTNSLYLNWGCNSLIYVIQYLIAKLAVILPLKILKFNKKWRKINNSKLLSLCNLYRIGIFKTNDSMFTILVDL